MVQEASITYRGSLADTIRVLTTGYGCNEADLAEIFDVTRRTMTRWKDQNAALSRAKQDLVRILVDLLALGHEVIGSDIEVKLWFHSPVHALEGQKPIDVIKTESGRRRVESVLHQLEAGVY